MRGRLGFLIFLILSMLSISMVNLSDVSRAENAPPTYVSILRPVNHTSVVGGQSVYFIVDVLDPDMADGQVLTVTWESNVSGRFMTLFTTNELRFIKADLPPGVHNITVNVTDGEYTKGAWVELTVYEYIPPKEREYDLSVPEGGRGWLLVILVPLAVLASALLTRRSYRWRSLDIPDGDGEARPAPTHERGGQPGEVSPAEKEGDGQEEEVHDYASLSRKLGEMVATMEAQREVDRGAPPPTQPQPASGEVASTTQAAPAVIPPIDDLVERERTREVREVMKALTQLPSGLSNTLMRWDFGELAGAVVDGERMQSPDGRPLVRIGNEWYHADPNRPMDFLREWSPPPERTPKAIYGEERKLAMLEAGLLSGRISEETYERLRRKFGG